MLKLIKLDRLNSIHRLKTKNIRFDVEFIFVAILTEEFGLDWMGIRGRFVGRNVYSLNDWESRLGRISEAEAGISHGV